MAHYTITIKTLIDNDFDFQMTSYPIFDENYRNVLNQKILNHYYESEIGFETAALFRFYLNTKLNEIMPYYNELYRAQKNLIDNDLLLNNVNLEERLAGTNSNSTTDNTTNNTTTSGQSSSTSTSSGTNNGKNVFQDTPQGSVLNQTLDDASLYATNVTLDRNTSSNSITDSSSNSGTASNTIARTGSLNGTNSYIKTITGNNGGRFNIDLLKDIEEKLMNIDLMVINQLNDLFMGIF